MLKSPTQGLSALIAMIMLVSPLYAEEPVQVTIRSLSAPIASQLANAAYADCTARGFQVAVAVVARDGSLLAFVRNPLAGPHTIEVSQRKAYTSATFKAPTTQLMGREFMRDIPGALLIGGGLPINVGGYFYGAVGVSGAPTEKKPGDVDDACAEAGIQAVSEDIEMGG
jgi:uncharacterized protein GlcG (DUF336 family)